MKQILRQTSWLLSAQILTKTIGFFYTIFLAKSLGVEEFGLLIVSLAYFSIISSIADFGFNRYLIREVAKEKGNISEILSNIVLLRLTLTSVVFGIFAFTLYLFDSDKFRVLLILMAVLAILPQSVALTFDGIFVALKKLQFSAIALIISSLFNAILGFYLISQRVGAMGAVDSLIISQLIYVLVLLMFLFNNKILPISFVTLPIIKKALIGSLPYGLLAVLGLLYFRIDAILLSYLKGNFETGIYGASYKFLEAIIFIPSSFAAALFPSLTKLHDENLLQMKKLYFKSVKLMSILGISLLACYLLILPQVIRIFLPSYLGAIDAIRILSLSIPFIFAATPGVQVLLSTEKYLKPVLLISVFTLIFNVSLNLLFIPKFGFLGASWITVLSDILSFTIFFVLINNSVLGKRYR